MSESIRQKILKFLKCIDAYIIIISLMKILIKFAIKLARLKN